MIIFDVQASRNFCFAIFNGRKIHVFVYFNQTVGPCSIFPLVQVGVSDTQLHDHGPSGGRPGPQPCGGWVHHTQTPHSMSGTVEEH